MFNVLGADIRGARVLDLFAGTGALGLEALSRGAADATFVERDREALVCLRANLAALGLGDRARILTQDALEATTSLAGAHAEFDCVFLDPPYSGEDALRFVEVLALDRILSENAVLVVQTSQRTPLPEQSGALRQAWQRRYGESRLTLYRKERACP
jgi:16S rRNA (guanine966-N2)-methyltransferase